MDLRISYRCFDFVLFIDRITLVCLYNLEHRESGFNQWCGNSNYTEWHFSQQLCTQAIQFKRILLCFFMLDKYYYVRHGHIVINTELNYTHFFIFSSDCCLSFSRSIIVSWANLRSPSSFLFARSRSMRSFFSYSREPSSCVKRED